MTMEEMPADQDAGEPEPTDVPPAKSPATEPDITDDGG